MTINSHLRGENMSKTGMRIAIPAEHVSFIVQNDVAVIVKKPIIIDVGCGARHRLVFKSPFLLRGGVKLFPIKHEEENKTHMERKLKYATIMLVDGWISAKGYLVFEKLPDKENEYKLVNDEPSHVLYTCHHAVRSRTHSAKIFTNLPKDSILYNKLTDCRTSGDALLVAIVPINTTFMLCKNNPPYRREAIETFECYSISTSTIPPSEKFVTETIDPEPLLSYKADEIQPI